MDEWTRARIMAATEIFISQTRQLQLWKADDVELDRLLSTSVKLADELVEECAAYSNDDGEDDDGSH